ncbi:MAG TPA: NAD(P)H-hydrate dehydratase [Solirubrobacteraceae bacterium]|nr:NAD(P)H-hydrate dehydratase [Solirubrobacteraceae bacterium]
MSCLPGWCEPLLDADAMRAVDRWAIDERGVTLLELMERAGLGVARALEQHMPDGPVVVVCGKGNNGGDGLVTARVLRAAGRAVTVVCTAPAHELSGDARANLARLPGEPPIELAGAALADAAVIVDALLGTGFEGAPRGAVAAAIEAINGAPGAVLSVDVPSGVDASTGAVAGAGVRAALTVTFHASKPGLWIHPGKAHAGEVLRIDIGIPRGAPGEPQVGLITPEVLNELPRRAPTGSKFVSGHVVVAGGSRGLTGAPSMAAQACMRAGAGYVTACVPASQQAIVAAGLLEVMTRALPDEDGALTRAGVELVLKATGRGGALALALGPGLGRSDAAGAFARELARAATVALVLDADGLNAHAGRLEELSARAAPTVLTPHAGELARLFEVDSDEIERARLEHVREAARRARAVVVLKGDDTLIAEPGGRVAVSAGGSPALATAGTGDVLTGVIAALLAQGVGAFAAASAGVWVHAQAGRDAARAQGAPEGVIASDVIAALPGARAGGRA